MNRKGKPKILLNMIVKNESHIILEALTSVYKYLSYYVINDTGSTDNTKEIIKEFFDSKGIPGEIVEHEFRTCKCHGPEYKKYDWFHYGWNRTYAINLCWGKSDYILFMDADDMIVGDLPIDNLTANAYSLKIGDNFVHYRTHLVKNRKILGWKYVGGRHEYLTGTKNIPSIKLEGNYHYVARTMGDRSKDTDRFLKDALIFEELLKEEPNNERHVFYCAQSYYDGKDYAKSMIMYEKRFYMKGFQEECYYSLYRVGICKRFLNYPEKEIIDALMRAYKYRSHRAEPIYEIINYLRNKNEFEKAYSYRDIALKIPFPENDVLFISKNVYDYLILDELATCAFYLNKFDDAYSLWNKIIKENRCKDDNTNKFILGNLEQTKVYQKILDKRDKLKLVISIGYAPDYSRNIEEINGSELLIKKVSEGLVEKYDVYIFGTSIRGASINNVNYLNSSFLKKFAQDNIIDILIISRYIHYFLENNIYAKKIFLWCYDGFLQPYWNGQLIPNSGIDLYNNIKHHIDGIIVLSNWHYENVCSIVPHEKGKIHVLEECIEKFNFPPIEKIKNRFICTLSDKNNVIHLINKFKIIRSSYPDATLFIIDNPENYNDIKIPSYIQILNFTKQQDIIKELYQSEYWIYPSIYPESYCYTSLLALYCGCICISSNVGSLKNILFNRGILVDIEKGPDTDDYWNILTDKIVNFNKIEEIKKLCLENAKNWAEKQTVEERIKQWLEILE